MDGRGGMTVLQYDTTVTSAAARLGISLCNHPLSNGRTKCVHVKGAPAIGYEPCGHGGIYGQGGDDRCWHPFAKGRSHRHSHTWQMGDARYSRVGDKLVDMETGEVTGIWPNGAPQVIERVKAARAGWTEADTRANARRVLRLHGFKLPDNDGYAAPVDHIMEAKITVEWHYQGASGWAYGTDQAGHNYELSPAGKLSRLYSLNERHDAMAYMGRFGASKAARKFDIPQRTIRSWAERG